MRKLKFRLDRKSLEVVYTAFIGPILEYGDVVWDNCSQYEKQEIEKVQSHWEKDENITNLLFSTK